MSNQKLLQQMIGVTLVMLLLVGCGAPAATPVPPTPTPIPPTPTPTPKGPMSGVWGGSTNQSGKEIGFVLPADRSKVCELSLDYSSSCGMIGGSRGKATDCVPISPDGHFIYERQDTAWGSSYTDRIEGDFTSVTAASGTFQHQEGSCDVVTGTWSASLTDSPTPTPRVCPAIRPGRWDGVASFTVSEDRSRVLDFSIRLNFGPPLGTVKFDIPELPITDCEIGFDGSSGGLTFEGSGTFTSETEISGGASASSSTGVGSGTWISWWDSE